MRTLVSKYWAVLLAMAAPLSAFAEEHGAATTAHQGWAPYAAVGFGIAIAVAGAATAQGKVAATFMEGVSRNPGAQKSMFVPLILGLALIETLVLFAFLVMNFLLGKF